MATPWSTATSSINDHAIYAKDIIDSYHKTNINANDISTQQYYGLSLDDKNVSIKCEDGESRNLREYVLWAIKGFPKKIEHITATIVTESEMLI